MHHLDVRTAFSHSRPNAADHVEPSEHRQEQADVSFPCPFYTYSETMFAPPKKFFIKEEQFFYTPFTLHRIYTARIIPSQTNHPDIQF